MAARLLSARDAIRATSRQRSAIIVKVTRILGDVNGDGKADGKDVAIVGKAFGSYPSHQRWNFRADINQNSRIEGKDIARIAKNFGTYDP